MEKRETKDLSVHSEKEVKLAQWVHSEKKVRRVRRAHKVNVELPVHPEKKVRRVRREFKVRRVNVVRSAQLVQ
jgi:hypothetical protein